MGRLAPEATGRPSGHSGSSVSGRGVDPDWLGRPRGSPEDAKRPSWMGEARRGCGRLRAVASCLGASVWQSLSRESATKALRRAPSLCPAPRGGGCKPGSPRLIGCVCSEAVPDPGHAPSQVCPPLRCLTLAHILFGAGDTGDGGKRETTVQQFVPGLPLSNERQRSGCLDEGRPAAGHGSSRAISCCPSSTYGLAATPLARDFKVATSVCAEVAILSGQRAGRPGAEWLRTPSPSKIG